MIFLEKLKKIGYPTRCNSKESFENYIELFTDNKLQQERLALYSDIKNTLNLETVAHAKHFLIKEIFADYIQENLNIANNQAFNKDSHGAKETFDLIEKIRNVFKNHDIVNYKQFILESEPNITETEVDLLFMNPKLNGLELDRLTNAFIKALGKKTEISNTEDFQIKFFSHPLIRCLDSNSDMRYIEKLINENQIELGSYKPLVEVMFQLKTKVNAEAYQAFITFLIKEDLTKGFSNIIKTKGYQPETLKSLLIDLSKGNSVQNEQVNMIASEIKNTFSQNVRLDKKEIKYVNTSQGSLNDYGFKVEENGLNIFFHGHATENHGERQAEQQANTANLIFKNSSFDEVIGLTVTQYSVIKADHHRDYLKKEGFNEKLRMNSTEEIIMSNLILDASYFKLLSESVDKCLDYGVNPQQKLLQSKILSTNHLIVKDDIERSQKIIINNIGKNDLELFLEKKNGYFEIFKRNKDFFEDVLSQGTTNNYLSFELISKPVMSFISTALTIEENAKIKIFTDEDIELIKSFTAVEKNNAEITSQNVLIKNILRRRSGEVLENVNVEKYNYLSSIINLDEKKEEKSDKNNLQKGHVKIINDYHLKDALFFLDKNPLNENYSKRYISGVVKALGENIVNDTSGLLSYRDDKNKLIREGLKELISILTNGESVQFAKSDHGESKYHNIYRTPSFLLKEEGKTNEQIQNDRLILRGLLKIAEYSGSKLTCHKVENLKNRL